MRERRKAFMHKKVQIIAAILGIIACGPCWAAWPEDKPVEVVIGFAAGGGTDVMARKLLPFVEKRVGGKAQYTMDDIRLVARVVDDPSILVVRADSKLTSLSDVLAALRGKPGSVTFGHNGAGTNGHLAIRMLAGAAKVQPNEISYRGTAAQRTDLLGGHLEVGMVSLSELPELHGGNKGPLRAIAILSKQRFASLPDVPTAE